MSIFARVTHALEGVGIALDSIRANKGRAALTIMGVAVGVFVVVALSSVVRGVNESFARDVAAAGPTSFFVYRRPIGGFQSCDPTRPELVPRAPQSGDHERGSARHRAAAVDLRRHAARRERQRRSSTRTASLSAGIEYYSPNWTDVDGGDIYPGPQLHARRIRRRRRAS